MNFPKHNTINPAQCPESQLWNVDMAYVDNMPYIRVLRNATSKACPLCSLEISSRHLLGGCRHRNMAKSYIERHNEAGRLILKAVTKYSEGHSVFIADLRTEQIMRGMGAKEICFPPP